MPGQFKVLAGNKVIGFPDGNILSWCPQMDLLAISMNFTSIWVFRSDGERIYSINNRSKILHLKWSHSGRFFVVSGTDNMIKVYDSNTGKLVNNFSTNADMEITLVSWEAIDIDKSVRQGKDVAPFQDLFRVEILNNMPKLANEITSLKVSEILDPSNAPEKSVSVTNTNEDKSSMDYLFVVNANSRASFTFDNLFTVSNIELPDQFSVSHHLMARDLFSQFLLVEDTNSNLHLQELTINIAQLSQRKNLFDSISWASKLISIMNHVTEQLEIVRTEAKTFMGLFDRYLSNYKDTLYEDGDLTSNSATAEMVEDEMFNDLTGMLLSGLIKTNMKDFWLNQFGEKGLIRLSTIGNTCYDNIRKIIFTQIILACEKVIILSTYLESCATTEFYLQREPYGIDTKVVSQAIENAQNVIKELYAFIWEMNKEHNSFNIFLNWVKIEIILKLSKEDTDPEEFFKENPNLNFQATDVMEYIDKYLFDSVLWHFLDIQQLDSGVLMNKNNRALKGKQLIAALQTDIKAVTNGIEQYLADNVSFKEPKSLEIHCEDEKTDIELFAEGILITAASDTILTLVQFHNESQKRTETHFPGLIIAHKIISIDKVLVLHKVTDSKYFMDLIKVELTDASQTLHPRNKLKSLEFNAETFVKVPKYMTLNSIRNDSHIVGLVMDESKRQYVVFEI